MVRLIESGGSKRRIHSFNPISENKCIKCLSFRKNYCKKLRLRKGPGDYCNHSFKENVNMKFLNFAHDYYKLRKGIFPTVRGRDTIKNYEIGEYIKIMKKRKFYCYAKVVELKQCKISDLSLNFIKNDGEFPNLTINSHEEFIDLLNSFGPRKIYPKAKANHETIITVIKVVKVRV